jgi:hypothetical protein
MGKWDPLLCLVVQSDLEFSLDSDLTVCETSSPSICESSSPSFLDVEYSSDEAILEAMIMYL